MAIGNRAVLQRVAETFADWDGECVDLHEGPRDAQTGKYAELRLLGRGGLGEVMEVFDADLRRRVALKRPRADHINGRTTKALIREAQITAQLAHPNIPAVHALGFDDEDRPYFTMVRLRGRSLAQVLAEDDVSRAWKMRTFIQIAYAVAFAHSLRVLHRDLKPENVMIGDFGQVHLVDWGIAKLIGAADDDVDDLSVTSSEASHTRVGGFQGTPMYAAPEQIAGVADLDERADIYALGAVLYEMLAGRPHRDGEPTDAIEGYCAVGFKSLDAEAAGINAILASALSEDREGRYDSVLTMIDDIEALPAGGKLSIDENPARRFQRFYFGRSEGVNRLRNFEVDMLGLCGGLFGIALGSWATTWISGLEALFLIGGVVAGIPPLWAYMGPGRATDAQTGSASSVTRGTMASRDSRDHPPGPREDGPPH